MPGKKVYLYLFTAAEPRGFSGRVGGEGRKGQSMHARRRSTVE